MPDPVPDPVGEGGEKCQDCGRRYPHVWTAPDAMWLEVMGKEGGLLCIDCFDCRFPEPLRWVPRLLSDPFERTAQPAPEQPQGERLTEAEVQALDRAVQMALAAHGKRAGAPVPDSLIATLEAARPKLLALLDLALDIPAAPVPHSDGLRERIEAEVEVLRKAASRTPSAFADGELNHAADRLTTLLSDKQGESE